MESGPPRARRAERLDELDASLAAHGHNLGSTRVRIAALRSGIVAGVPGGQLIHVSWWVLSALAVLCGAQVRRRGRRH